MSRRCQVIAEFGLNHNGSIARALEMVKAVAAAGCDAAKIQAFTADEFVGGDETYGYLERDGAGGFRRVTERQREMFARCALTFEAIQEIHAECVKKGLTFVATATDAGWIDRLKTLNPAPILKVGSDDIVHAPLLRLMAASRLPVILSTGMATEAEIAAALSIVRPLALLHCVSLYPTPPIKANLTRMIQLAKFNIPVGFSDHTEGTLVPMMAAAMGANVIEKHFTLDKGLAGPDHWFSVDPQEMAQLVSSVRVASTIRGSGAIDPGSEEMEQRKAFRRSVVAALDLPAGTVLKAAHVAYRRPGTGLPPGAERPLLGRMTSHRVAAGEQITEGAFLQVGEVVH